MASIIATVVLSGGEGGVQFAPSQVTVDKQGHIVECMDKLDQLSLGKTIHSLSARFVPADTDQFVLGSHTLFFLTNVWSRVASVVPATSQPVPGSAPSVPTASIRKKDPKPSSFAKPTASLPFQATAPLVKSETASIIGSAKLLAIK